MADDDLAVGGMGLNVFTPDLEANPLALSPDLRGPSLDTSMIYRGMYNPLAPLGRAAGSASSASPASNFDLAFGDSIAVQQINNKRIWGGAGQQYNASNPEPFNVWNTAAVSDPPSRILARAQYAISQNPDYFKGKNVFSAIGSNDTSQMDAIGQYLKLLKDNGAANVVVPGLGPGVKGSDAANAALKKLVEDNGFTYFQPNVQWQSDGVHPNSKQMFDQASIALGQATPPSTAAPTQAPASLVPQPAAPNALSPVPYTPYTGPNADIYNHALYYGVDPELAMTTARIESNFGRDPDRAGSQYKGVFQLGNTEWNSMGGTDANRGDRATQINLGTALISQRQQEMANSLGRTPQNYEIYMAHNQGVAGATALINNPNMTAKEALMSVGVSPSMAEASIRGNGGEKFVNAPASEFVKHWSDTYDHFKGQIGDTSQYASVSPVIPGHYGYTSGQHVGGGFAAGGKLAGSIPQPGPGPGPATPLGPLPTPSPTTPAATASMTPPEGGINDAAMRRAMLFSMIGRMVQGAKFTPVSYDPFKVHEAGVADPGLGGRLPTVEGYRPMQSPVQSVGAARPISVSIGRSQRVQGLARSGVGGSGRPPINPIEEFM